MKTRVDTDKVKETADWCIKTAKGVETEIKSLTSKAAELEHYWEGTAAASFQTVYADWKKIEPQIVQSLEELKAGLSTAEQNYLSAESASTFKSR